MRNSFILAVLLIACGCASKIDISRNVTSVIRRMPQANLIETGRPMRKGSFTFAFTGAYALAQPDYLLISDSSFEARSSPIGDEVSIVSGHTIYLVESRWIVSGEAFYAISDVFSSGISIDASFGEVHNPTNVQSRTIQNLNLEGSLSVRFAKGFDRISVAIRPELVFTNCFGDRVTQEWVDEDTMPLTATDKLNWYSLAVRSSSAISVDVLEWLASFAGMQIKSQPIFNNSDGTDQDVAYSIFGGFVLSKGMITLSPFIAFPLGSTFGHFRSPPSIGIKSSITFLD